MTTARFIQLLFRLIMALLVGKAGMDAKTAESLAQPAADLGGAGALFLIDLIIHSARWQAILEELEKLRAWYQQAGPVTLNGEPLPPASGGRDAFTTLPQASPDAPKGQTVGLNILAFFVLCGLCALCGSMSGCAQSETNRVAQGMIEVQISASNVDDALNAGVITVDQAKRIEPFIKAEQKAVKDYYAAIRAGDSAALAAAKAALAAAIVAAEPELAKLHIPATTPIVLPNLAPTTGPEK